MHPTNVDYLPTFIASRHVPENLYLGFVIRVLLAPDDFLLFKGLTNIPVINSSHRPTLMCPSILLRTSFKQTRYSLMQFSEHFERHKTLSINIDDLPIWHMNEKLITEK
jgi:hypothetical protein